MDYVRGVVWRVFAVLGGVSFLAGGLDILTSGCRAVDFGGTARFSTYSCVPANQGQMPAGVAGTGMVAIGLAMLTLALWPVLRVLVSIRPNNFSSSLAPTNTHGVSAPSSDWGPVEDAMRNDRDRMRLFLALRTLRMSGYGKHPPAAFLIVDGDFPLLVWHEGQLLGCSPAQVLCFYSEAVDSLTLDSDQSGNVTQLRMGDWGAPNPRPRHALLHFRQVVPHHGSPVESTSLLSASNSGTSPESGSTHQPLPSPLAAERTIANSGARRATSETEAVFCTFDWELDGLRSVLEELDLRGVSYELDEGWLVVDKPVEAFVTRVVERANLRP